jgi:predicted dehydrogenase
MFRFAAAREAEMAVFAEVIAGTRTAPANHHAALAALRIAAAAKQSQQRRQPVDLADLTS